MEEYYKKYGLILRAFGITIILLGIRLFIVYLNLDILSVTNLITAFIGGAIFTIAIIYTGTLTDYKESEKIPGELATSIRILYSDMAFIRVNEKSIIDNMYIKIYNLLLCINTNFRNNCWNVSEVSNHIDIINSDIANLVDLNTPPNYIVIMKAELSTIERISHRVMTISHTSFIPAAYAIAEISACGVLIILFLIDVEPFFEGIVLFTVLSLLLTALLLLIRDMDNPFEEGKKTFADIDLFLLWDLEKELRERIIRETE